MKRHKTRAAPGGFTLVEMLVVIVIIGILTALSVVAITAALDKGHQTQIKAEMDQIAAAFEQYKNKYGSYPPNTYLATNDPQQAAELRAQVRRHILKAFPRCKDKFDFLLSLQMTPDEAIVFWLGGFSSDPEFPFSGPGGPAIPLDANQNANFVERDNALFEFDEARLGPRDGQGNLVPRRELINIEDSTDPPYKEFEQTVLLYTYTPPRLQEPFIYFDTSRQESRDPLQVPPDPNLLYAGHQHQLDGWIPSQGVARPFARLRDNSDPSNPVYAFVNPDSFQVMAAGTDDEWSNRGQDDPWPLYPDGPFLGAMADNLVSFHTNKLEDVE